MITATLEAEDIARAERLMARAPNVLVEALRLANMESSKALVEQIKDQKLRGQVLNRITGTLLRSWAAKVPPVREENGWLGGAGSNLGYAAYHEFGFHGEVFVRAHSRRAARTRTAKGNFRKRPADAATGEVRAYSYQRNYAGRPYARPALGEIRARVVKIHRARVIKAQIVGWDK